MDEMNPTQPAKPNNHMVMAIVSTVLSVITCTFLGLIAGIVSIVFASQVNTKYNAGDYHGAEKASKNAKIAWIVAIVITVVLLIYTVVVLGASWDEFMEQFNAEMERQQQLQGQ
jgi:formate hydrogenlyase subunit 3/multisubunit Na+/H+ antiporter MnhD subunit